MINENLTELPEKWYVKVPQESLEDISKFRKTKNYHALKYPSYEVIISSDASGDDKTAAESKKYIEISFSQFKRWVLKEEFKDVYNQEDYIVFEDKSFGGSWIKVGEIAILGGRWWTENSQRDVNDKSYLKAITVNNPEGNACTVPVKFRLATENEIVAYKRGIRNISEIKKEPKQDLSKTVVHCITQEEWNYVIDNMPSICGKNWFKNTGKCGLFFNNTWTDDINQYKLKDIIVFTFSEWCKQFNHNPEFMNKEEKQLTVDDLVEGEIYIQDLNNNKNQLYLFKKEITKAIDISNDDFNPYWENNNFSGSFKLATPEEKQWLEACIKQNKFISKEEAMKFINIKSVVEEQIKNEEDLIGRWVKTLVDRFVGLSNKKGDYLKVENKNCITWGGHNDYLFTPSEHVDKFELMPIGFEPLTEKVEEKPKFEVGKWYQHLGSNDSIGKFVRLEGTTFWMNEYIHGIEKEYQSSKSESSYQLLRKDVCEIPLSEIQQYLPEGHPDKIVEKKEIVINKEELLAKAKRDYPIGTIIFSTGSNRNFIINGLPKLDIGNNNISCETLLEENKQRNVCYLYYQNEWVKIISKPEVKEEVFPFVKRKYYSCSVLGNSWRKLIFQFKANNNDVLQTLCHKIDNRD